MAETQRIRGSGEVQELCAQVRNNEFGAQTSREEIRALTEKLRRMELRKIAEKAASQDTTASSSGPKDAEALRLALEANSLKYAEELKRQMAACDQHHKIQADAYKEAVDKRFEKKCEKLTERLAQAEAVAKASPTAGGGASGPTARPPAVPAAVPKSEGGGASGPTAIVTPTKPIYTVDGPVYPTPDPGWCKYGCGRPVIGSLLICCRDCKGVRGPHTDTCHPRQGLAPPPTTPKTKEVSFDKSLTTTEVFTNPPLPETPEQISKRQDQAQAESFGYYEDSLRLRDERNYWYDRLEVSRAAEDAAQKQVSEKYAEEQAAANKLVEELRA